MRQNRQCPIVLEDCTTQQFIRHVIKQHKPPTNLVICSSRNAFLQHLWSEIEPSPTEGDQDDVTGPQSPLDIQPDKDYTHIDLLNPTLSLLATTRTISVVFCPDLTHLLAFLSVLPNRRASDLYAVPEVEGDQNRTRPMLAILNPIRLHRPTSSFSAQGFNRTFASAVEAAHYLGQQLVLCEALENMPSTHLGEEDGMDDHDHELNTDERAHVPRQPDRAWDEQLSMLNVTTKTFGVGERGWVGRTVSIRQVAQRWCRFSRLDQDSPLNPRKPDNDHMPHIL